MNYIQNKIKQHYLLKAYLGFLYLLALLPCSFASTPGNEEETLYHARERLFYYHLENLPTFPSYPSLFITYYPDNELHKQHVLELANQLFIAHMPQDHIHLDEWTNRPGSEYTTHKHSDLIFTDDKVLLIGSPDLKRNYEKFTSQEIENLRSRRVDKGPGGLILLLFEGQAADVFPQGLREFNPRSLAEDYYAGFFNLLIDLCDLDPRDNPIKHSYKNFKRQWSNPPQEILLPYGRRLEQNRQEENLEDKKNWKKALLYEKRENPFQQPICTLSTGDDNRKNKKQVLTPNSKGKEKEEEDIDDRLKTIFILSIDSGGARVTIPLLILEYIEEQVRRKFHQDISITDCFDLIAGTSSSSISVLGLASINLKRENKRYTVSEVSELYKNSLEYLYPPKGFFHSLFHSMLRMHYNSYDASNFKFFLEKFFQDSSSKDNSLKDLHTPIFIPAYDLDGNNIYCFDSEEAKTPSKNFLLKDVALAASADPTYQNPVGISSEAGEKYHFISGIFHAQNPSLLALKKAKEIYPDAKNVILISLGTGSIAQPPHHYGKLNKAGLLLWLTPIIDIIWNSNTQFQEYLIDQGESVIKDKDDSIKYIRINPKLPIENSAMDDTSESNMDILRGIARKCFNKSTDEGKKIETIIQYFVDYLKEQGYKTISGNVDVHSQSIKQLIKNAMGNNKLELINREISNSDVYFINEVMNEFKNHLSIEILDLSNNKINEFGIKNIAFLMRQYPGLTKLILNDNQIGDVGVNLISTFFIKTHLTYLEIENCGITDAGLFSIASFLEKMPSFECINIKRNKVSPKTILLFINNEKIKW